MAGWDRCAAPVLSGSEQQHGRHGRGRPAGSREPTRSAAGRGRLRAQPRQESRSAGTRPGRQPAASPPRLPSAVRGAALPAAAPPLRGGGGPSPPSSGPGPGPRLRLRVTILAPSACMPGPASAPRRWCAPGTTTPSTPRARRAALPGPEVQWRFRRASRAPGARSAPGPASPARGGCGAGTVRSGGDAGRGPRSAWGPGPAAPSSASPRSCERRPRSAWGVPGPRAPRWAAAPERA